MRRSKIFYVPSSIVVDVFREDVDRNQTYHPRIPRDAVVRSSQYIKERDVFMFVVDHYSFDLITEGKLLPSVLMSQT